MATTTIDAALLQKMFLAGAKNLEAKKEWINELNVFPVPDGDTGTNMTMTIMSAAKEVASLSDHSMEALCKAISSGSLRGARGNSGVILSQLLRGFTKVVKEQEELDTEVLSEAFEKAVATAYKAVMQPKEGTILTVAKGASEKAKQLLDETDDLTVFIDGVIKEAEYVLSKTPDMLPVLKQAGVVDSGGQGLVEVLKGARDAFLGKEIDYAVEGATEGTGSLQKITAETEAEIRFGYCTEYIIVLNRPLKDSEEDEYRAFLESIGDSIVLVADDDIVKTHVHTNEPGVALTKALTFGSLSKIKIDNMREEHQEKLFKEAEKQAALKKAESKKKTPAAEWKEVGFIAVSIGEGLNQIFKELGVDHIIEGGQTMNPSTEDILNAVDQVNAKTIFVLPNNKNIILAAEQATHLSDDKNLVVIPTKTIPQGITALINYEEGISPEENQERMTNELSSVKTGQVTYAVRDTEIDDKTIKQGDYMGIGDKTILSVGTDLEEVVVNMAKEMVDDEAGMISVYYGEEVDEQAADALAEKLTEAFPDLEIELNNGGQPIYYYILSVE
ncbi:MAG: DAK2 domain-containing protein [Lachnospiraceae bacterium]|nr:DAK2 domain-containing protein [Lachnospiraceae bacterium]